MEMRSRVNVATGALGPVLAKLTALLGDHQHKLAVAGCRRDDIEFIRSELEQVHSLLLTIWEREDLGAACKEWMAEARELSYGMEDDINEFLRGLELGHHGGGGGGSPFEGLKDQVQRLLSRCSDEWKGLSRHANKPTTVDDRRPSRFLHRRRQQQDAVASEQLVEMDEKKGQLVRLLQLCGTVCIVGSAGIGKTTLAQVVYHAVAEQFECRAFATASPRRPSAMQILTTILGQLLLSSNAATTDGGRQVNCRENTDSNAADEKLIEFLKQETRVINLQEQTPTGTPDSTDVEAAIATIEKFLNAKREASDRVPSAYSAAAEKYLIKKISDFLIEKRYLVTIDDIWHWEQWEVIRNSLPENNLGSRIITTTRVIAIAEKCRTENCASVYKIAGISPDSAAFLWERIFKESCMVCNIPSEMLSLCFSVSKMSGGLPLAAICMSLAVAEQLAPEEGQELDLDTVTCDEFHVAKSRALEGFLTNPCLRPLVESFCLSYNELPLHLKTCLLHCSMYPPYHILEMNDLSRMWISEGFVYEEEEARSYADDLVNMGLIQRCFSTPASSLKFEMNAMMLHFLRCKSQDAYFAAALRRGSDDISSLHSTRQRIHRISIDSYQNGVDFSRLDHVHVRSLYAFDYTWDAQLEDICKLLGLKSLSLRVSLINLLPAQIKCLQHLKTLDLSNTGILSLPEEIGELKRLETLYICNTMVTKLPMEIRTLQQLKTLNARNTCIKELPREFGELNHLETLDVSYTMVAELPREIAQLKHFKTLHARGTGIREFCREVVGELHCPLKMLDLRSTMVAELPSEIGKLNHLETLDVSSTMVAELPSEIGKLNHLETLDVSITMVAELPKEIGELQRLKNLDISGTLVEELPKEIRELQLLETLDVSRTKVAELPKEIWELKRLKTLNISNTLVRLSELPWESGNRSNSLHVLVGDSNPPKAVKVLGADCQAWANNGDTSLISDLREKLSIKLFDLSWEPLEFARFKVAGTHKSIPPWVKDGLKEISSLEISLWKLEENDLEFLGNMPELKVLALMLQLRPEKPIAITGHRFLKLESFCVDCRVPRVRFYEGAMPKLKHIEFRFYASRATQGTMGFRNLRSLQRVVFKSGTPRYRSDAPCISAIINGARKEIVEHPNWITLCINGTEEEAVIQNSTAYDMRQGHRITIDDDASVMQVTNGIANKGEILPVSSYYPFGTLAE